MFEITFVKPGSEGGPCAADKCHHLDCAQAKQITALLCPFCLKPLGYERPLRRGKKISGLAHAECYGSHD